MENIIKGIGIFFIGAIFCAGFSVIAYNEGNQIGFDEGHGIGYGEGHGVGYGEGHGIGFNVGNETGYIQGREDGIPNAFTSVGELSEWLRQDDTDRQQYIETYHDCEDFAMDLVNAANEDGYTMYLFTDILYGWDGSFWVYTIRGVEYVMYEDVLDIFNGHAYNFVIIDGGIWFIEPQSDKIWYGGTEL